MNLSPKKNKNMKLKTIGLPEVQYARDPCQCASIEVTLPPFLSSAVYNTEGPELSYPIPPLNIFIFLLHCNFSLLYVA